MTVRTDPERNETEALFELVEFVGAEVLEIGCGDGRLTWRYAERAAHVTAIEPFGGSIARAKVRLRGTHLPVEFRHANLEAFAADNDADLFDIALLSWSLC